jgi:hypothetical protein
VTDRINPILLRFLAHIFLPANMEFRSADTFTDSLARLAGDEQKAVKTMAFDLQLNPAQPGMRCTRARDHLLVTGIKPGSEFLDDLRA